MGSEMVSFKRKGCSLPEWGSQEIAYKLNYFTGRHGTFRTDESFLYTFDFYY
jgi:hypothetical protein